MVTRLVAAALVVSANAGCNLLLDVGDHELRPFDAGDAAVPDGGEAGGQGGGGGQGGAGAGGSSASGGGGGCMAAGGSGGAVVIACGQSRPNAIVATSSHTYWINEGDGDKGAIVRAPKGGGRPTIVAGELGRPVDFRLDFNVAHVLFTNDDASPGIYIVKTEGGPLSLVDSDGYGVGSLVFSAGGLYSEAYAPGEPARVRKTNLGTLNGMGGCYPYTSDAPGGRVPAIIPNESFVYLADTAKSAILRAGTDCDAAWIVFANNQAGVRAMSNHPTFIYWATPDAVWRLPKSNPGGMPDPVAAGYRDIRDLDMFGEVVVFTEAADGIVVRVDASGTHVIATGQAEPQGISIGPLGVSWANSAAGEIMYLENPN